MSELLSADEFERLRQAEHVITSGLQTFVEVGLALSAIRDERLYRVHFDTFEEYLNERWEISRPRAYELMTAAKVVSAIADKAPDVMPPQNEAQSRALAKVPEEQRAEVWQKVVDVTDGKPTAAAVREAAQPQPVQPVPAPTTLRDPFSVPESPSQEVPSVPPTATLDRETFLAQRADQEAADHARQVSDSLRRIIKYCVEGLASPPIQKQYAEIYLPPPPDTHDRVPVNAENIEAAGNALLEFAQVWRKNRATPEEQH